MLYVKNTEVNRKPSSNETPFGKIFKRIILAAVLIASVQIIDAVNWKVNATWKEMKVIQITSTPRFGLPGIFGNFFTIRVIENDQSKLVQLYPWFIIGVTDKYDDNNLSSILHTIDNSTWDGKKLKCLTAPSFFHPVEVIGDCTEE